MGKRNKILTIFVVLLVFNILTWLAVFDLSRPRLLKVDFLDIGQGDAIFIETPKRTQILIDGGPSSKIIEELGSVLPFYDRSIDFVISTHPDADHISGLIDVLKQYKVGLVGFNGTKSSKPEPQKFKEQIAKNQIPTKVLKKGQTILIGDNLKFEILAPLEDFEGREVSDFNTSSIVAKMTYGNNSFLFTGDAPKSIEQALVKANTDLDSDVLKVGHHGSKTSTTENFLKMVSPEIAVIQAGKDNRYGHPHKEVLEALNKYGIKIFRNDSQGDIKIFSDGKNLKINNN